MRTSARLAAVVVVSVALVGCSVGAGDAGPSDQPAPVDASPSPVASTSPEPSDALTDAPDLETDAGTQYFLAICPTLVLEQSLEVLIGDDSTRLGPARTTTAYAVFDGADVLVADWVEWSDASVETRTRLSADMQAYGEALIAADLTPASLAAAVDTSPLDGADSMELRVELGYSADLDLACAGG